MHKWLNYFHLPCPYVLLIFETADAGICKLLRTILIGQNHRLTLFVPGIFRYQWLDGHQSKWRLNYLLNFWENLETFQCFFLRQNYFTYWPLFKAFSIQKIIYSCAICSEPNTDDGNNGRERISPSQGRSLYLMLLFWPT